jgi:serine/threonine protein kinase
VTSTRADREILSEGSDSAEYVLKRLKNAKREEYFEREIHACERLNHLNVLKIVEHGNTPRGKPYLINPLLRGRLARGK